MNPVVYRCLSTSFSKVRLGGAIALLSLLSPSLSQAQYAVSGTKITNGGAEFVVKGTNIEGQSVYFWRDCSNDAALVKTWGFNTVRIRCYLGDPYAGIWTQYPRTKEWLYGMVDKFRAQGIVVIICVHDLTGSYPTATSVPTFAQLKAYHADLATRYKTDSGVWFNMSNEPGNDSAPFWQAVDPLWETTAKEFITAIRATGNNNIIMLDGHLWGQDAGGYDAANVPEWRSAILSNGVSVLNSDPRRNVVFSNHYYEQWDFGGVARIVDYMTRIAAKGLCLVVGEYGSETATNTAGAAIAPGRLSALTSNVLTAARQRNVGRMVWSWDCGDNWDLVNYADPGIAYAPSGGGWQINRTDGTKPTNLSWLGEQVWADNRMASTSVSTNLVSNSGFESGQVSPWASWYTSAPLSVVTGFAKAGTYSMRVLGNTGGQQSLSGFTPGRTYTLTASGRLATADGSTLSVTVCGDGFSQSLSFTTKTYTTKTLTFTAPANITWMQVQTWKAPGTTGYVDEISVR